jgi:outer membrane protein insertion porin family
MPGARLRRSTPPRPVASLPGEAAGAPLLALMLLAASSAAPAEVLAQGNAPGPVGGSPPAAAESPAESPAAPSADPFAPLGDIPQAAPAQPPAETPAAARDEPRVLLSEIVVEGLAGHPEQARLEQVVYDAITVTPGTEVTRSELKTDLAAIYATGWFSDVRMAPQDGPLGVRLIVTATPNPVLTKVSLEPPDAKVPPQVVQETFAADLGRTLNLKTLQTRMEELQKWYADQGYSLARVSGPSRISPEGEVQLAVRQGTVAGVEVHRPPTTRASRSAARPSPG